MFVNKRAGRDLGDGVAKKVGEKAAGLCVAATYGCNSFPRSLVEGEIIGDVSWVEGWNRGVIGLLELEEGDSPH